MKMIVTGAAGFIGFHTASAALQRGDTVIGYDNLNAYYDPRLKAARLALLSAHPRFRFVEGDVADPDAMNALVAAEPDCTAIVHLAAQAGVAYSIENPLAYVQSNVAGQVVVFEAARRLAGLKQVVYASSSSVYGENETTPFRETDRVDQPVSLYAATKRAGELIARTYAHVHGIASTGLRFFTVYGPYGRPDMAPWLFTEAIMAGRPITLFNEGRMRRDFTFVDDVVAGTLAAVDRAPEPAETRIFNLGNNRPVELRTFVAAIERAVGRAATIVEAPMRAADVVETCADIETSAAELGYRPRTPLEEGIPRFVDWYRSWSNGVPEG